ncbi:hypothetical protein [Lysinibacillus sp. BPa_S21]|uniref:DUF6915 family protein n=1 Tax=Lysinibacillus sp. BPa_S21 TaxID=2932478 RepID=UPI002012E908|nr:hypothetical protein [Lysinibacillus sp. BPa_S21]MCL1696360.1 hypothetical protein [Lysinibacillus sp. BPa_S21]
MSHPNIHAKSSARKFGGKMEDYLAIHDWFDDSKSHMADMRHRALKHHSAGIYEAERVFGNSIINSDGKEVFVRYIGEQHVLEDWFENMEMQKWMQSRDMRIHKANKAKDKLPKSMNDKIKEI